jgi:hypothetical protein
LSDLDKELSQIGGFGARIVPLVLPILHLMDCKRKS